MHHIEEYREANAWLQQGGAADFPPYALQGPPAASFAMAEWRSGIARLVGADASTGEESLRTADLCQEDAAFRVSFALDESLPPEGYALQGEKGCLLLRASDSRGLLYAVYACLAKLRLGESPETISCRMEPRVSHRVINHWDNLDGGIERGYSGRSLFFQDGELSYDEKRVTAYARLLASIGVNELSINNVNVTARSAALITPEYLPRVAALAGLLRPFGIRLILSVHFESPVLLGGLATADPLDPGVAAWWRAAAELVYSYVPDLAGFLVKADSEFRGGPASLGRTQADGANVIARALAPHGGIVYWRCFVYNCQQDWRDIHTDRAKAAYEHFQPLDGDFEKNAVLQIKFGPMDFQVREPNSPLLGAMPGTRQAIELQITQEYTGQQIDLYALPVQWEEILDTPVADERVTRDLLGREIEAVIGVSNIGDDDNWTGHTLAQANLFAFGRMAWNPHYTAREVLSEWVALTFGRSSSFAPLVDMLLKSRAVYEKYTTPLGIGWMVNVGRHYGPSVDGYEYSRWGAYHRADHKAIGVDRTANGTGFARQYPPGIERLYSDLSTCPEELLLFFHRLPYDYRLRSGKTLLQTIYDLHFEGAEDVRQMIGSWVSMKAHLPPSAYESVLAQLKRQLQNAREWRDVVNTYFLRKTGITDEQGRTIWP